MQIFSYMNLGVHITIDNSKGNVTLWLDLIEPWWNTHYHNTNIISVELDLNNQEYSYENKLYNEKKLLTLTYLHITIWIFPSSWWVGDSFGQEGLMVVILFLIAIMPWQILRCNLSVNLLERNPPLQGLLSFVSSVSSASVSSVLHEVCLRYVFNNINDVSRIRREISHNKCEFELCIYCRDWLAYRDVKSVILAVVWI